MTDTKQQTATGRAIAERFAEKIFAERKGHGGGPCSYMQISRETLANIIETGIEADRAINNRNAHDDMRAALEASLYVVQMAVESGIFAPDGDREDRHALKLIKAALAKYTPVSR